MSFKGNNQLHLNLATVMAAMQQYLDSVMDPAPLVTDVKAHTDSHTPTFIVHVKEKEPPGNAGGGGKEGVGIALMPNSPPPFGRERK